MNILLTGGAGYIGSHTIIELDKAGHSVVVVDNLVNSNPESLRRVAKIIGKDIPFYEVDVRNKEALSKAFDENAFDAVIHFAGLKAIERKCGLGLYNLGTGHGYSVLDVVKAFMKVNGVNVPYVFKPRRPGDIATCYCNPAKAKAELGWEAQYGIKEMCRDSWNWQRNNPNGY